MKTKVLSLSLLLLTACAHIEYSPYEGPQKPWPTSDGAFIRRVQGFPIIRGLPDKPYTVLGHISVTADADSADASYVRAARARGADALLFIDSGTLTAGSVSSGIGSVQATKGGPMIFGNTFSTALQQKTLEAVLIKFK